MRQLVPSAVVCIGAGKARNKHSRKHTLRQAKQGHDEGQLADVPNECCLHGPVAAPCVIETAGGFLGIDVRYRVGE